MSKEIKNDDGKSIRFGYLYPLIEKAVIKINATGLDKLTFSSYVRRSVIAMLKKDKILKSLNGKDVAHLEFVYGRMVQVHKEDVNSDCMIRFREILDKLKNETANVTKPV
jgi:hypothetical protein